MDDDDDVHRHVRVKDASKVQKSVDSVKGSSGVAVEEGGYCGAESTDDTGHRNEDDEADEGRRIVESGQFVN
jgi:hypothetical protein